RSEAYGRRVDAADVQRPIHSRKDFPTIAFSLVSNLRSKGVNFAIHNEQLAVDAPKGTLTEVLRQAIRQHKEAIIAILEAFEERAAIAEYCGGLSRGDAERLAWESLVGKEL